MCLNIRHNLCTNRGQGSAMKNVTEFSGVILLRGAKVRADKLAELKAAAKSAVPTVAADEIATSPVDAPPAEDQAGDNADVASEVQVAAEAEAEAAAEAATPAEAEAEAPAEALAEAAAEAPAEAAAEAPAEAAAEAATPAEAAAPAEAAEPAEAAAEAEAPKAPQVDEEALSAAIAEEMGFSPDRTKYLLGALKAVGRKGTDQVRNVRVFQGEEGPRGCFSIDDLHFVVDRVVVASKQSGKDDRKGRGGKGRDGKSRGGGGQGRPSGGPGAGRGGSGFDAMAKDEKIGEVPSGGLGWSLARKPGSDPKDGRKPGRKGPKRGKPGDKPGSSRNRSRDRKGGAGGGRKPPAPQVSFKAPLQTAPKAEAAKPASEPKTAPAAAPDTTATETK
jgi:chemotaxis protein histidine kinase CheA